MCPERFTWTFYFVIVQKSCNLTDQCPRYLGGPSLEGAVLPRSLGLLDDVTLLGLELLQVLAQSVHLVGPGIQSIIDGSLRTHPWSLSSWVKFEIGISTTLLLIRTDFRGSDPSLKTCNMSGMPKVLCLSLHYYSLFEIIQSDATCHNSQFMYRLVVNSTVSKFREPLN